MGPVLHELGMASLKKIFERNEEMKKAIADAYAYAIFPSVGKAAAVIGVTYGPGEVLKKGNVIGYAGLIEITAGIQIGGTTFHLLVLMDDEDALKRFKSGKVSFAANASASIVKAGAMAERNPNGLRVYSVSEGGEMLELAIGVQTFRFKPAVIGRLLRAA